MPGCWRCPAPARDLNGLNTPARGQVSRSALYELAAVEGENAQRALWAQAKGGMTVREMRAAKPRTRPNLEPMRVLGTSLNRIGKDIEAMRAVRSAMVSEHHERLRELRRQIDDLLGE